jgi:hypothetical protein
MDRKKTFLLGRLLVFAALVGLPLLMGCPTPPPPPPGTLTASASASPAIGVAGTVVSLNATATAAAGGALSFAWTQTGGNPPDIPITNANTANASFTAPATVGQLVFRVTVTEAGGGTITADATFTVTANPVTKALYVSNQLGNRVTGYTQLSGASAPNACNLSGAASLVSSPRGLSIDSSLNLIVGNDGNDSITSYTPVTNPAALIGNIAPQRNLQGAGAFLGALRGIFRQASTDLLYVSVAGATPRILVFQGASTSQLNGNTPPFHTITSPVLNNPRGLCVDANDNLYVANETAAPRVFVFASASTKSGDFQPTRTIFSNAGGDSTFVHIRDVFVDSQNHLYVVDDQNPLATPNPRIHMYANAQTPDGDSPPSANLRITSAGSGLINNIVVDNAGTGYISDRTANRVYSYTNLLTTGNGPKAPDGTLEGAATQLNGPYALLIVE